jgi:antitoxin component YwqK of YwqJK toxin-antitoxin module
MEKAYIDIIDKIYKKTETLEISFFENNKLEGEYKKYNKNGNLSIIYVCQNNNIIEFKQYYNENLLKHSFCKNNLNSIDIHNGQHLIYNKKGGLKISCFYLNNKLEGEYKIYYQNGNISTVYVCHNNNIIEYKKYYKNAALHIHHYNKNSIKNGTYKEYSKNNKLLFYNYYINDQLIIKNFKFKIEFALLRFKDILKGKIRKPRYELLDKYFIQDISNIIGSYLFALSSLNITEKRILY